MWWHEKSRRRNHQRRQVKICSIFFYLFTFLWNCWQCSIHQSMQKRRKKHEKTKWTNFVKKKFSKHFRHLQFTNKKSASAANVFITSLYELERREILCVCVWIWNDVWSVFFCSRLDLIFLNIILFKRICKMEMEHNCTHKMMNTIQNEIDTSRNIVCLK